LALLEPDHLALDSYGARMGSAGRELEADQAADADDGDRRGRRDRTQGEGPAARRARRIERERRLLELGGAERLRDGGDRYREVVTLGTSSEVRLEQYLLEVRELVVKTKGRPFT